MSDIYKPYDFYKVSANKVLKDGHTMLMGDVEADLNNFRSGFLKLQKQNAELKKRIDQLNEEADSMMPPI